ncbi:TPA: alpha/beta hydrolase [Acinetobacter baumannii]|jgi:pimeloyl-ACP methyl ester carboxylesterase|uniref:Serine aminopeptidase S33 domain-containing protein n=22 Tax=Acinetobacter calcoaceticus/baumannii complex TaxID=909768 RepID=A0ABX6CJE1_ACIB2|nr:MULTISPECIES: alpha/beta hydrolase [Acinetobacter]ADX93816.1 alpha/beta fold family hydrolase [Acinetobacter baumannii TCDC-AB0715]AHX28888.1 lysophospholipase [Acinetobacter baumannii AC12]AHX65747.1 lysophospholipase [Acinetobacter baumannii AC30]EMT92534.1 alpha/beta fold family hydrolase [Acinetobacter baumannii ABNIH5]EMT95776.1 alpha/beta fold family hydrolase [Acinetobacter baumannii ABNIH6]EMU07356.1 alpha/beta fold family hydrolase [Acinetobacter baumannii ABNIH10]ETY68878.1 lyso
MHAYTVEPLYVPCDQEMIAADFYIPKTNNKSAVIIMAHGFAGLRQFKLIQYAQRFAQAGYAVILFDYRYWGGSTGKPREMISINSQLEDWKTMIQYASTCKFIDNRRIVLWGTSLSGGYALSLASELKNIQAIMVQIPYVDGAETAKLYPLQRYPQALKLSSQDYMGSKMGLNPKRLPVVDQYKLCFMPTADSYYGYLSIVNPDYYWSGEVPARVFFNLMRYRPIQLVRQINIPVLFIAAQHDSLIPIESSREAATNIAPFVSYHEWDMKHFDIYHGSWFEKAVTTQLEFLHQHIGVM